MSDILEFEMNKIDIFFVFVFVPWFVRVRLFSICRAPTVVSGRAIISCSMFYASVSSWPDSVDVRQDPLRWQCKLRLRLRFTIALLQCAFVQNSICISHEPICPFMKTDLLRFSVLDSILCCRRLNGIAVNVDSQFDHFEIGNFLNYFPSRNQCIGEFVDFVSRFKWLFFRRKRR